MQPKEILALMAGCDSRKPIAFDDLVKASGMEPAKLEAMLEYMFSNAPFLVNRAQITRAGQTQMVYWPTGVLVDFNFSVNPKKRPQFTPSPVQRSEKPAPRLQHAAATETIANQMASKAIKQVEKTQMQTNDSREPVTLKHVLDIVTATPGIKRETVMQLLVYGDGSNKKQVSKIISNATFLKRLFQDADGGLYLPHTVPAAPASTPAPVEKRAESDSNIREFRRADKPDTVKPESERQYGAQQVYVDATGQLIIMQPGLVRMVFPADDTRQIQKLLLAIDLESLCA